MSEENCGVIIRALSGFYDVDTGSKIVRCRARGKLRKLGITPLVGDQAVFQPSGDSGYVQEILPRKNSFIRPAVANVDVLVMMGCQVNPITEPFLIDRVAAIAAAQNVETLLLLTKCDLDPAEELYAIYRQAGIPVIRTSTETGLGVEEVRERLKGKLAAFTGNSGVGKSTMTVLLAGYFHYVMGYNVAVVDCDYPQFSIKALRSRDTQNVEKNVNLQRMLCGQFDRTGKKAYPVLTSVPGKELKTALPLTGGCDILFFDLPGTVNSPGVIKTIVNMDYVFTPIIQDRMVMQSSLSFLLALKDFIQQNPDMPLKEIRMFWNRMDGRVSKRLSYQYGLLFKELGLKALDTVIPDMERYGRETSPEERILFRSTLFPPSGKLLKGSGLDTLAGEIECIIHPDRQKA